MEPTLLNLESTLPKFSTTGLQKFLVVSAISEGKLQNKRGFGGRATNKCEKTVQRFASGTGTSSPCLQLSKST
jgi:hypothetical protein